MRVRLKTGSLCNMCSTILLALALPAFAQSSPAPKQDEALTKTLAHLAELAAAEKTQIPSFECTETGVSTVVHGDKMKKRVTFNATIQARRNEKGSLDETFRVHMLDGQPYDKEKVNLPLYLTGGFSNALGAFEPDKEGCVVFALSPGRIDFAAKSDVDKIPGCRPNVGLTGFALLDADGMVTHIEHRVPKETAYKLHMSTFGSIDLKPVELNGKVYWLTSTIVGELPSGGDLLRFEAMYSVCHRYATTITIGAASEHPADEPGSPAPK